MKTVDKLQIGTTLIIGIITISISLLQFFHSDFLTSKWFYLSSLAGAVLALAYWIISKAIEKKDKE